MKNFSNLKRRLATYKNCQALVQQQTGKSALQQIREILDLRKMGGQCGISDYYGYKLYDIEYLQGRGPEDFLGWPLRGAFNYALNPRHAALPGWDKLAFMVLADAVGLPVAPIKATYSRSRKIAGCLGLHLADMSQAAKFLRDASVYPLFAKPSYSQQGYGSAYLASYETETDQIKLLDGTSIALSKFLVRLEETVDHRYHKPEAGFLFQSPLKLAPEIEKISHWNATCGARVICLNGPDGCKPVRAIWKIAVPPNQVDNFSLGKYGNLLANIDLTTGEISRVLTGFWPETTILSEHPLSHASFNGFRLPGWDKVLSACKMGGELFPLMKVHHWDFAFTNEGPLILELNDEGGIEISQLHGHGMLTQEIREFLKRFGNQQDHPWIKAL